MALHIYPATIRGVTPPIQCLLARPTPKTRTAPTLIYFHGLNGSRKQIFQGRYAELAEAIQENGWNILSVELRGHGSRRVNKNLSAIENIVNTITSNDHNPLDGALADIPAIVDFLLDKKIASVGAIATAGLSWGGMHALYALQKEPRIQCAAALMPICKITGMVEFQELEGHPLVERFEPLHALRELAPKPLLMITTEKDRRAHPRYASQLYEKTAARIRAGRRGWAPHLRYASWDRSRLRFRNDPDYSTMVAESSTMADLVFRDH